MLKIKSKKPEPILKDKYCELPSCGKLLIRRPKEQFSRWRNRSFCNAKCSGNKFREFSLSRQSNEADRQMILEAMKVQKRFQDNIIKKADTVQK